MRIALFFGLVLSFQAFAQTMPNCNYADLETSHQSYESWQDTFLDTLYKVSENYAPTDLIPLSDLGAADYKVRAFITEDLRALFLSAERAGAALEIQSAYRSYTYQVQTFQYWVDKEGEAAALKTSARAGHSEHQLGTALDFRSKGGPAPWDLEDWAESEAGAWLAENAWHYGFVMSYPKGKEALTCYSYEPWHYRYMGRDLARAIKESGLTLREWLWARQ